MALYGYARRQHVLADLGRSLQRGRRGWSRWPSRPGSHRAAGGAQRLLLHGEILVEMAVAAGSSQ